MSDRKVSIKSRLIVDFHFEFAYCMYNVKFIQVIHYVCVKKLHFNMHTGSAVR